jgi:two-component system CheB/CheR fusion protein
VCWTLADGQLRLEWAETGGQMPEETSAKGFGTVLVQTSSRQLGAQLDRKSVDGRFLLSLTLPETVLAHD